MNAVLHRIGFSIAAVLVASVIVFGATEALPGDYANASLGRDFTPAHLTLVRHQLGLDRPVYVRYGIWLSHTATGRFEPSYTGIDTWQLTRPRLVNSIALAVAAMILTIPIAVLLGIVSGLRPGGLFDGVSGAITLVAISLPEFVVAVFLATLFGIVWRVLPAASLFPADSSAFHYPRQLVLPAVAVASVTIGYIARMTRAATLDVLDSDYIRAARLRGISGRELVLSHVLRNALIPVITVIGNNVAWMLTGLVAVELIFAYPGLGSLLINAIHTRDAPLIGTIALFVTVAFVTVNLLTDLAASLLNPRAASRQ